MTSSSNKVTLITLVFVLVYFKLGPVFIGISGGYQGPKGNQALLTRYHAIFYGAIVLFIAAGYLLLAVTKDFSLRIDRNFEIPFVLFFVVFTIIGTIVGLINNNDIYYIIGDVFKSLFTVAVYFLAKYFLQRSSLKNCFLFFWVLVLIHILYIAYGFFLNIITIYLEGGYRRHVYISKIAFCVATSMLLSNGTRIRQKLMWFALFMFVCIQHVFTLSRSTIILSVFSFLIIFFFSTINNNRKANFGILSLLVLVLVVIIIGTGINKRIPFERVTSLITKKTQDTTVDGRMYEIRSALGNLKNDTISIIIGNGYGAKVKLLENKIPDMYRFHRYHINFDSKMHNIHNGFVSVLFRTGIFGVIVFLWFILSLARYSITSLARIQNLGALQSSIAIAIVAYIFSMIIHFGITYVLIGNPFFVILVAYLVRLRKESKGVIKSDKIVKTMSHQGIM